MRNLLLGLVAGLVLGAVSTWGYETYLDKGPELTKTQTDLDSVRTSLDATKQRDKELKSETEAISAEVQQLTTRNVELKRQLDDLKGSSVAGNAVGTEAPNPMAGFIKEFGAQQQNQKFLLLKSRLHLTPEQEAVLKAAMDEESRKTEAMTAKMLQGGKIDPQALKDAGSVKTVDQTLKEILTPEQETAYGQMQDDQKKTNAETSATFEMNQAAPMLQLTDAQKDQVYSALYQVQIDSLNPAIAKKMSTNPADPSFYLEAQEQAKEDALSKILSPQQLATYHQQAQSQLQMQKTMMQKFAPATATAPAAGAAAP